MQIDRPISIAVILFVVVVLIYFLVMPQYNTFQDLQLELGKKTAEYNAKYDYYAAIDKTYFDLQAKQEELKKVDDALPTKSDTGKIMYYFQRTATENGLMIKSLFLSKTSTEKSGTVNDVIFSMNVLGDYDSLKKFIMALEESSRIFEVSTIAFGSSGSAPTSESTPEEENLQFQVQQTYDFSLQIKTHTY